ncbi:MAG: calcium-binding protein [Marinibacterium sp.]
MPVFNGTGANDFLWGGAYDDILRGRGGNDRLYGNGGNDWLGGGRGNDGLWGGSGNDTLLGKDGDDTLDGGSGNDILQGGEGQDILTGGAGADVFYFVEGDSNDVNDTITDFEVGVDTIIIDVGTPYSWGIYDYASQGEVIIANLAGGGASDDVIILEGITDFAAFEANANILFV